MRRSGSRTLKLSLAFFGKLVGRIADERQALDVTHDEEENEDARLRGSGLLL